MIEKIEGIVIDIVRHNDRHNVVTLFTRSRGRMAFLVPAPKSKAGRKRNSTLLLMACVGADVNIKSGKELHNLSVVSPIRVWRTLYFSPVKSSLVFFLTEFLNKFLRQSPPEESLWDFIISSLETLDSLDERKLANFHIAFLKQLLAPAGIMPSLERHEPGMVFDMQQGEFQDPALIFNRLQSVLLTPEESGFVNLLSRINYRNMWRLKLTKQQRAAVLNRMLQYYSLHLSTSFSLKSLEILAEIL